MTREIVVGFTPEQVRAPFLLRCGALLIDYIVVVAIPVIGLVISRLVGDGEASGLNTAGWLIAILVAICNLLLLPMFTGQTIGKIFTGLRIVRSDGRTPSLRAIAVRQTFGYFVTLATGGLGFLISGITPTGRSLHDLVAGTVVIFADRQVRK